MMKYSLNTVGPEITQVLSEDSERVFCRAWRLDDDGRLVGAAAGERSEMGNKGLRGRRSCSQSVTSIQRDLGAIHLFQSRIVRFGEWP